MIALRYKRLKSGKYSIYLDQYDEDIKKRTYQFLKLQVTKDYSKNEKIDPRDKEIMRLAMLAFQKAKEKIHKNHSSQEIENSDNGFEACSALLSFLKKEFPQDKNLKSLLNHLEKFLLERDISVSCLTKQLIIDFREYLSEKLSERTVLSSLLMLRTYINRAIRQGIIDKNPFDGFEIKKIPNEERPFLTMKECRKLANTPTSFNPQVRDAFFFALHTGLRWEDTKYLLQKQVTITGEKGREQFCLTLLHRQSDKTYTIELEKEAIDILKDYINHKDGLVFAKLPNKPNCNIKLRLWGAMAGINKNVCFSMARNSFAIRLLEKGNTKREASRKTGMIHTDSFRVYEKMASKLNKPQ